ncbi:MAG: tetratricopeptide repeat protein [Thermoanaerobaculales bacterium]
MPIKLRTTVWLLSLIFLVPALAFAEKVGTLVGKVVDEEHNPLPGVIVTVTSSQIPKFKDVKTTDKKGVFTVDFPEVDVTYHYRFDKVGYQSMEVSQQWSFVGSQFFQWTMRPGQSAAPSAGSPPASTSQDAILAYNAGVIASRAKDQATAAAKFREAVGHDPKLRQAWESLGVAESQLGHYQEAADAAEKAVALGSTDRAVLEARWQAYRNLKNDAKAAEALKDLERVGRQTEEAKKVHNEAVALLKAKDYAGAFAKFQEAVAIDPTLQASQVGLSEAALKTGHNAEAASAAEAILKKDPKNEQAIRVRYNACLALGDKQRLIDSLVGLAPLEPAIARNGLLKLSFEAYDANDMVQAKDRFAKVLVVDPTYALAHYYLGLIAVGQGASADAKSHFERFLELAPNDKEADSAREALKYLGKS